MTVVKMDNAINPLELANVTLVLLDLNVTKKLRMPVEIDVKTAVHAIKRTENVFVQKDSRGRIATINHV